MKLIKSFCLVFCLTFFLFSCSAGTNTRQTFAQAHDAFQTKLSVENNDDYEIPPPPEGVFDLIRYPSKVGDLAAYVSSDPGDGEKHPLIIWVVGGWGNGIDEFPWSYAPWDNDQTASAFWEAGVLTMYPSFRGGSGNPGNYETLFGEIDDIASAYEYAAKLPYVDPTRIYLGGHSTGGTRALLASEYMDDFRAVFCFGAVDEIKYHNNDQFTFDTSRKEEFVMRSPIHWLEDVHTKTFLIEGEDGNSASLKKMQEKSQNEQISCYMIDGADHFSTLAPITELLAQKILSDTGEKTNITLTQEELQNAMKQEPKEPTPLFVPYENKTFGLRFSYPFTWEIEDVSTDEVLKFYLASQYSEDNIWDMASAYVNIFQTEMPDYFNEVTKYFQSEGYTVEEAERSGFPAIEANGVSKNQDGSLFTSKILLIQKDDIYVEFDFYIHESYGARANSLFQTMIDSISFD